MAFDPENSTAAASSNGPASIKKKTCTRFSKRRCRVKHTRIVALPPFISTAAESLSSSHELAPPALKLALCIDPDARPLIKLAMADSYRTSMHDELDEIHRLLPREILEDIGIVDPAGQQALDVVDVLGVAQKKTSYHHHHHHHHPQANVGHGLGGRMDALAGKVSAPGVAAPPFLPSPPAVTWHVMEGLRRNSMVLHPNPMDTMPGFAPTRPLIAGGARPPPPTTVCRGVGTGVFLPRRTEVVRRTAKAPRPPPPSSGNYARMIHQRVQQQAAMVIVRSQQEMLAVADHMDRRRYFLGVHPHPELALPQEWTY